MKKRTKIDARMVDNENPEWTAADFRKARPAREMAPEIVAAYERSRGRPVGRKKAVISRNCLAVPSESGGSQA